MMKMVYLNEVHFSLTPKQARELKDVLRGVMEAGDPIDVPSIVKLMHDQLLHISESPEA